MERMLCHSGDDFSGQTTIRSSQKRLVPPWEWHPKVQNVIARRPGRDVENETFMGVDQKGMVQSPGTGHGCLDQKQLLIAYKGKLTKHKPFLSSICSSVGGKHKLNFCSTTQLDLNWFRRTTPVRTLSTIRRGPGVKSKQGWQSKHYLYSSCLVT